MQLGKLWRDGILRKSSRIRLRYTYPPYGVRSFPTQKRIILHAFQPSTPASLSPNSACAPTLVVWSTWELLRTRGSTMLTRISSRLGTPPARASPAGASRPTHSGATSFHSNWAITMVAALFVRLRHTGRLRVLACSFAARSARQADAAGRFAAWAFGTNAVRRSVRGAGMS